MKLRSALLAATILAAAPVAAKAQAISGLYIGAGAGANFMEDQTIKGVSFPNSFVPGLASSSGIFASGGKNDVKMRDGFIGVLSVGYGLGNGLRFEVEGSFRQNKFQKVENSGLNFTSAGGDEHKFGAMVNALY